MKTVECPAEESGRKGRVRSEERSGEAQLLARAIRRQSRAWRAERERRIQEYARRYAERQEVFGEVE